MRHEMTMFAKCARALAADAFSMPWEDLDARAQATITGYVCTVLATLMEPSKEMLAAGETAVEDNIDETCDSYECYEIYNETELAHAAWTAMIRHVLESGQ